MINVVMCSSLSCDTTCRCLHWKHATDFHVCHQEATGSRVHLWPEVVQSSSGNRYGKPSTGIVGEESHGKNEKNNREGIYSNRERGLIIRIHQHHKICRSLQIVVLDSVTCRFVQKALDLNPSKPNRRSVDLGRPSLKFTAVDFRKWIHKSSDR